MPVISTLGAASSRGFGEFNQQAGPVYIENVFSTYIYNGNGGSQTITNNINLSTYGGMVWGKSRNTTNLNWVVDTARGVNNQLYTSTTDAQNDVGSFLTVNTSGFSFNNDGATWNDVANIYTSWTFRKQPKFFDIVQYNGNGGTSQTINHNLGSTPGMMIIKRIDTNGYDWVVYHQSLGNSARLSLNLTSSTISGSGNWNDTSPTSTQFTVGNSTLLNASGGTYIAYLFAHNAGGFGADGSQNVISCGSYTGNGSATGPIIDLGYEPQFILVKGAVANSATFGSPDWDIADIFRGISMGGTYARISANLSSAETATTAVELTQTGFQVKTTNENWNANTATYIYMAIRRGPMATPTDATKVFMPTVYTGTNVDNRLVDTTIAPDTVWIRQRNSTTVGGMVVGDRLRGQPYLVTGTTAAEVNDADSFDQQLVSAVEYGTAFSSMSGVWVGNDATSQLNASTTASNQIAEAFKRAPGFHDVVSYQGTGSTQSIPHNLGVVPQMIIVKNRTAAPYEWAVYTEKLTATSCLFLNSNSAGYTDISIWNNTSPTSSVFTVKDMSETNQNGQTFSAYLFASCPKVSKVGFYTGTGTTNQIDCGFTSGARFVLIKRTGTTGSWYVYDSARGIVAGNDPYILTNSTAGEVTGTDYVDTYAAGFELSSTAPADLNANGGTYIFLAIA